jgi:hypothetical protein
MPTLRFTVSEDAEIEPRTVAVFALTVRVATTWQHLIHTRLPGLIHFPNSINISPDSLHLFYVMVSLPMHGVSNISVIDACFAAGV